MYCSFQKHWVNKRCSSFKGGPIDTPDFKCHSYLHLPESDYEEVDKFCHLGDTLSASGGAEASSITQIRAD